MRVSVSCKARIRSRFGSFACGAGVSISGGAGHAAAAGLLAEIPELPILLCEGRVVALAGGAAGLAAGLAAVVAGFEVLPALGAEGAAAGL